MESAAVPEAPAAQKRPPALDKPAQTIAKEAWRPSPSQRHPTKAQSHKGPPAPRKTTPYFSIKARSAFLFYKFYKFRQNYLLFFRCLHGYRQGIGPQRQGIGRELLVDRQAKHKVTTCLWGKQPKWLRIAPTIRQKPSCRPKSRRASTCKTPRACGH